MEFWALRSGAISVRPLAGVNIIVLFMLNIFRVCYPASVLASLSLCVFIVWSLNSSDKAMEQNVQD